MSMQDDWATELPDLVDWTRPSAARIYDAHLGGSHNFAVDREVAAQIAATMPELPGILRANRAFLHRAVRHLVRAGITQFLDLGSGIPTVGNVHEIAQASDPACRVVYVDSDPIAVTHSTSLLQDNPNAIAIQADLRDPTRVLANPDVGRMLDFDQPIGVLLVSVLHFLPDSDLPQQTVAEYVDAVTAGSYLVLSHVSGDRRTDPQDTTQPHIRQAADMYSERVQGIHLRSREEIASLFGNTELIDPGLVRLTEWRPDDFDHTDNPNGYAGVAIKP